MLVLVAVTRAGGPKSVRTNDLVDSRRCAERTHAWGTLFIALIVRATVELATQSCRLLVRPRPYAHWPVARIVQARQFAH